MSSPSPSSRRPAGAPGAPWFERVPPERYVAWSGALLAGALVAVGLLVVREPAWVGMLEALVVGVVLAVVFVSPFRLGSVLSLATVTFVVVLEVFAGVLDEGLPARTLGLAFGVLGALLASAYIRLGIRRRDAELRVAAEAIAELTTRDRITELLSGGRESTWLEAEIARARRHHHRVSLVLLEPDDFGRFEESPPEAVLQVLEAVAETVGSELRATDVALRRSYSTFSLVLPETPSEGARVAAERIRLSLGARMYGGLPAVTISAGVATFPQDASTNDELVRAAERALARARERGGNRSVCVSLETPSPPGWTLGRASG